MSTYTRENKNGSATTFVFEKSKNLPRGLPISTPISFAFLDQRLLLVKKTNGWWDVVGGKIEGEEDYITTLNREAFEEGKVKIHAHTLIGHIQACTTDSSGIFPPSSLLPVTYSHIEKVHHPFESNREVLSRELLKRDELEEHLSSREDAGQLLQIAQYAFEVMRAAPDRYEFGYQEEITSGMKNIQTTQAAALVRNKEGKYYVVREKGSSKFLLPGGGCRIEEDGETCLRREILEELGITVGSLHFLGVVHVSARNNQGILLSEALHYRYFFETEESPHMPAGSEVEECKAVSLDELMTIAEHLKNENGPKIRAVLEKLHL